MASASFEAWALSWPWRALFGDRAAAALQAALRRAPRGRFVRELRSEVCAPAALRCAPPAAEHTESALQGQLRGGGEAGRVSEEPLARGLRRADALGLLALVPGGACHARGAK